MERKKEYKRRLPANTRLFDMEYFREQGLLEGGTQVVRGIGEGDSALFLNVLPPELAHRSFDDTREEIQWNEMFHKGGAVPRLISIQGSVAADGTEPVYRHPADEQPELVHWTSTVEHMRKVLIEKLGQEFNHALIQWYRSGQDYISEHTDKTLDIELGTDIVNLSLGASREMVLRTKLKDGRRTERVTLPHNSVFVLGWKTNRKWTHAIRKDGRAEGQKSEDELRDNCQRISLTFRTISTFVRGDGLLFGQGASKKTLEELNACSATISAADLTKKVEEEAESILHAFSNENRDPEFDWDTNYARGFDTICFKGPWQRRLEEEAARAE